MCVSGQAAAPVWWKYAAVWCDNCCSWGTFSVHLHDCVQLPFLRGWLEHWLLFQQIKCLKDISKCLNVSFLKCTTVCFDTYLYNLSVDPCMFLFLGPFFETGS